LLTLESVSSMVSEKQHLNSFGQNLISVISESMQIKKEMINCLIENEEQCQRSFNSPRQMIKSKNRHFT
jgi:hypothetical protein